MYVEVLFCIFYDVILLFLLEFVLTIFVYCLLFVLFFFSSRRRHTRCALVTGVQTCALPISAEEVASLAEETGASSVHVSGDWSHLAQCRRAALERALTPLGVDLVVHDETLVVVAPGAVVPHGKEHFAVFTPYHRAWSGQPRRPVLDPPDRLSTPRVRKGRIPAADTLCPGPRAQHLPEGGEGVGRKRMHDWVRTSVTAYDDHHDDPAGDDTSRLSPHLHHGWVSPAERASLAGRPPGAEATGRPLARQ